MAELHPERQEPKDLFGLMKELVVNVGDVSAPIDEEWDVLRGLLRQDASQ